jgi:hypothetical protein
MHYEHNVVTMFITSHLESINRRLTSSNNNESVPRPPRSETIVAVGMLRANYRHNFVMLLLLLLQVEVQMEGEMRRCLSVTFNNIL